MLVYIIPATILPFNILVFSISYGLVNENKAIILLLYYFYIIIPFSILVCPMIFSEDLLKT